MVAVALCTALTLCTACGSDAAKASLEPPPSPAPATAPKGDALPGMPAVTDAHNVYAQAGAGMLADAVKSAKPLVYVPHTKSGEVRVIDPATFVAVGAYRIGGELQHVVPSWDLTALYATDDTGNKIVPFDPATGTPGAAIPVTDPYNMYFTPDGAAAISVAEDLRRLVFYDPRTWAEQGELPVPDCAGIDHADFTPDGRTAVFTCEFAGRVAVVDIVGRTLLRMIDMPHRNTHMGPQDIKLAPDGSVFYIADADQNGLWVLDGA
ncbi:YncE family protein, partial [Pseudonocardia adelaidensis]